MIRRRSGDPTALGQRQVDTPRAGASIHGADGQPGIPVVTPSPHGVRGIPGGTGTGSPIQPGTRYDGMVDDEREGVL